MPPAARARASASSECARSQAASSVSPRIARSERLKRSERPFAVRGRAHALDVSARRVERLAPERVDVGVPRRDGDRRVGRPAEVDRQVRLLRGPHRRGGAFEAVELAGVVDRAVRGPDRAQHLEVLVGAAIARVVVAVVAVASLIGVAAARDHVHRKPAARELVEGGELARRERRRDEARPVSEQDSESLRVGEDVGRDDEAVGRVRVVADQHAIEAGLLVHARELARERHVDDGPFGACVSEEARVAIMPMNSTGIRCLPSGLVSQRVQHRRGQATLEPYAQRLVRCQAADGGFFDPGWPAPAIVPA